MGLVWGVGCGVWGDGARRPHTVGVCSALCVYYGYYG